MTNSQSIHNEEEAGFVSPVCKVFFAGPALEWAYYPYRLEMYACQVDHSTDSELVVTEGLAACTKSAQKYNVFIAGRMLAGSAMLLLILNL